MSSQSSPLSPNTLPLFITTTMQTAIQHDNLSCSTTTTVASSSAPSRSINSLSLRRTDRRSSPVPPTRFATSPAQSASVATSVVTAVGSFHPVHGDDDSHDRAGSMRSVAVPQMTALQTPPASPEDDSSEFSSSASSSSPVTPVVRIDLSTLPLLRRQRRGTTTSTTSARRKRAAKAAAQMQHPPPAPPSTKISTPPLSPKLVPTTTQQRKQKAPVLGIVAMTDVQATWVTRGGCCKPPIMSCQRVATGDSVYCVFHSCIGMNLDMNMCRGLVTNPEISRFCKGGVHSEIPEGKKELQDGRVYWDGIQAQAKIEEKRKLDVTVDHFNQQFGEILQVSLPAPMSDAPPVTATTAREATGRTAPRPNLGRTRSEPVWGSTSVDKWWEGDWCHHVPMPGELRQWADDYESSQSSRYGGSSCGAPSGPPTISGYGDGSFYDYRATSTSQSASFLHFRGATQ